MNSSLVNEADWVEGLVKRRECSHEQAKQGVRWGKVWYNDYRVALAKLEPHERTLFLKLGSLVGETFRSSLARTIGLSGYPSGTPDYATILSAFDTFEASFEGDDLVMIKTLLRS